MTSFPRAGFESVADNTHSTLTVRVPPGSGCFDGHFDGAPILPGIAHLALVLDACAARYGAACELTAIRDLRWRRPIRPGDEVAIDISGELAAASVTFTIKCGTEVASSGTVTIAVAGQPHA